MSQESKESSHSQGIIYIQNSLHLHDHSMNKTMELGEGGECFRHDTITKVDGTSRGERRGCCQLLEGVGVPGAIGEFWKR